MDVEHAEALGLEQKCLKPGYWVIEGHIVWRLTWKRGGTYWYILSIDATRVVYVTKTLEQARDWIRMNRGVGEYD